MKRNHKKYLKTCLAFEVEARYFNCARPGFGGLYPPTVTKLTKEPLPRGSCARRQNIKKCAAHGGRVKSYNQAQAQVNKFYIAIASWPWPFAPRSP